MCLLLQVHTWQYVGVQGSQRIALGPCFLPWNKVICCSLYYSSGIWLMSFWGSFCLWTNHTTGTLDCRPALPYVACPEFWRVCPLFSVCDPCAISTVLNLQHCKLLLGLILT